MPEKITPISRAISDVLTGAYAKKRLTQDELAERADMSIWTLQKKLKGRSPISATDLVLIARAIGVDPGDVLAEAIADVEKAGGPDTDRIDEGVSDEPSSVTPEDEIPYIGPASRPLHAAADEQERSPGKD